LSHRIGCVRKLEWKTDVAGCVDAPVGRLERGVNGDAGSVERDTVYYEFVGRFVGSVANHLLVSASLYRLDTGPERKYDPILSHLFLDDGRGIGILSRQDVFGLFDQRDLTAESGKRLG
jgi:hypothetical protein